MATRKPPKSPPASVPSTRRRSRDRGKHFVLLGLTVVCAVLCYLVMEPFLPAIIWAVTVAVITQPMLRRLGKHIASPSRRAGVAVTIVTVSIILPICTLSYFAAREIATSITEFQETRPWEQWQTMLEDARWAGEQRWIADNVDLQGPIQQIAGRVQAATMKIVAGSIYTLVFTLLTLFILFFLYRDHDAALDMARRFSPLSAAETNRLLDRLDDTIHATVYGTLVVAAVQGTLGGIMFGFLGVPAPILWGVVMGTLAVVPYLGTFVVWGPTALLMALQGSYGRAAILAGWGLTAIALIDNLIYPMLVGKRLRQHTVVSLIAIIGGVGLFGATGLILGPVLASFAQFLAEVWRRQSEPATQTVVEEAPPAP